MPFVEGGPARIHYLETGAGRPLVLLHGLLWSSRMFARLRRMLPGHRVIVLDLRGHGRSERPTDASLYTWEGFAEDVVRVLDHLRLDRAVVGGLSLGANVTLATGVAHPDRCAGLVIEMPVLSGARGLAERVFGGLASVLEAGERPLGRLGRAIRRAPVPPVPEVKAFRDMAALDPVSAAAVLRGLLGEGLPPHDRSTLAGLTMPALVIGHRRDPLHVLSDAKELAARLPDGRFVEASSIFEFRLRPERLARHLLRFLDDVWSGDGT